MPKLSLKNFIESSWSKKNWY